MRPISKIRVLISVGVWLCAGLAYGQQTLLQVGGGKGASGFVAGLINLWPMTNAQVSGNTVNDTADSDNGGISGNVTSAAGPNGTYAQGRGFDGTNTTAIISASSPLNWNSGSFSVAAWLFITANNTASSGGSAQRYYYDDRLGNGSNYFQILNIAPGGIRATTSGGQVQSTATNVVPNTTWTHFVLTNSGGGSGGTQTIYINGNVTASNTASGDDSFDGVQVGTMGNGNLVNGQLTGRLAGFRIYNRALSAADVLALFNAGG